MAHRRSSHGRLKQEQRRQRRQQKRIEYLRQQTENSIAQALLMRYSWRDPINKEVVHTEESAVIVKQKLETQFEGGCPMFVLEHDYGEVLNRRIYSAPPIYNYFIE